MTRIYNFAWCLFPIILSFISDQNKEKLYVLDPRELKETKVSLSDFADDIKYIPLSNDIPLGSIYKFEITQKSIYLSSKDIGILKYDRTGQRPVKIGSIGNGPGEYLYPMNFTVDPSSGTVYVADKGNKIKKYSEAGKFLKDFKINELIGSIDNISFYNSALFIYYFQQFGDATNQWVFTNSNGDVISVKKRSLPNFTSNWITAGGTYIFNKTLYYWDPYNDTVFRINSEFRPKPDFLIADGEHRFPRASIIPDERLKKMFDLDIVLETNKYRVFSYFFNNKRSILLVDKNNGKYFLKQWGKNDITGIPNDLDGGLAFEQLGYINEAGNEYLTGLIFPDKLKVHIKTDGFHNETSKYPNKKSELIKLADKLDETDNPVIVLLRLKK